jgi:hypothetical protein
MLAEYDQAAWHAIGRVLPASGQPHGEPIYLCQKLVNTWSCGFGVLAPENNRFLVWYEATQEGSDARFEVKHNDPPREDAGFYLIAAKAVVLARKDFQPTAEKRPYNGLVLPAASDQLYVYMVPAQTKNGVYPLGGDARYLISKDGSEIVEKRQLHKSILDMRLGDQPGKKVAGGFHTHVLSEMPEDTDVFYVLTRKPAIPEDIGAGKFRYEVRADGTIRRAK